MFGQKRRRRLERENERMRDALDWYADVRNWRRGVTKAEGEPMTWIKSPAAFDRGAQARHALGIVVSLDPSSSSFPDPEA